MDLLQVSADTWYSHGVYGPLESLCFARCVSMSEEQHTKSWAFETGTPKPCFISTENKWFRATLILRAFFSCFPHSSPRSSAMIWPDASSAIQSRYVIPIVQGSAIDGSWRRKQMPSTATISSLYHASNFCRPECSCHLNNTFFLGLIICRQTTQIGVEHTRKIIDVLKEPNL